MFYFSLPHGFLVAVSFSFILPHNLLHCNEEWTILIFFWESSTWIKWVWKIRLPFSKLPFFLFLILQQVLKMIYSIKRSIYSYFHFLVLYSFSIWQLLWNAFHSGIVFTLLLIMLYFFYLYIVLLIFFCLLVGFLLCQPLLNSIFFIFQFA